MFGLEKKYKKRIDALMLQYPYAFYVYGSRARGTHKLTSDLDLCIFSDISVMKLAEIKESFNNLMLPFTVDFVVWGRLSEDFKKIIEKDLRAYAPDPFIGATVVELSYQLSPHTPAWPGKKFAIHTESGDQQKFRIQTYTFSAGIGTHIDVPAHMFPHGKDLASIELRTLYAPCSFFVVPSDADASCVVTDAMLKNYETRCGPIAEHSWFVVMTGWGKKSADERAYQNVGSDNRMHFPKLSLAAAEYLMEKKILGLCVDTLSPDGDDPAFPIHHKLLSAGIYIIENLMYHNAPEGNGYFLQVVPLAISGGPESPVRVLLMRQDY
jgi:kynurenine formamidase/predicted nucleotidyltransferase